MRRDEFKDSDFNDIRPYRDEELRNVINRISKDPWIIKSLRRFLMPGLPGFLVPFGEGIIWLYLQLKLVRIRTVDDFHEIFMKKTVLEWIKKRTISELTNTGIHFVLRTKPSLFITNHRDITLDSAFLCFVLMQYNFKTPEIAFGDNLLINDFIADIIRINKSFIVRRNLPIRDQLKQSIHLSNYIWYILNKNHSIWIAQRGGRAKDGDDRTNPSLIKMLYLSQRKDGLDFSSFINACNIVPVAISYEFDPCDTMKAKEISISRTTGEYNKKRREDLVAILKGMNEPKGRVHYAFCEPLSGEWNSAKDVAEEIDGKIISNYRLFPSNYIAYDHHFSTDKYKNLYTTGERERFLARFEESPEHIRETAFEIYARPVINKETLPSASE